jgi:hypothetical protein
MKTGADYHLSMMKLILEATDEAILAQDSTVEVVLNALYEHHRRQAARLLSK